MSEDRIFQIFMDKFPRLNSDIEKHLKENMLDMNDGIYVLWGMGVMPCINKIIDNIEDYEDIALEIFDFFEEMANSGEEELIELLMYSTLEILGDDKRRLEVSKKFMKKETRILSDKVEDFLGR